MKKINNLNEIYELESKIFPNNFGDYKYMLDFIKKNKEFHNYLEYYETLYALYKEKYKKEIIIHGAKSIETIIIDINKNDYIIKKEKKTIERLKEYTILLPKEKKIPQYTMYYNTPFYITCSNYIDFSIKLSAMMKYSKNNISKNEILEKVLNKIMGGYFIKFYQNLIFLQILFFKAEKAEEFNNGNQLLLNKLLRKYILLEIKKKIKEKEIKFKDIKILNENEIISKILNDKDLLFNINKNIIISYTYKTNEDKIKKNDVHIDEIDLLNIFIITIINRVEIFFNELYLINEIHEQEKENIFLMKLEEIEEKVNIIGNISTDSKSVKVPTNKEDILNFLLEKPIKIKG